MSGSLVVVTLTLVLLGSLRTSAVNAREKHAGNEAALTSARAVRAWSSVSAKVTVEDTVTVSPLLKSGEAAPRGSVSLRSATMTGLLFTQTLAAALNSGLSAEPASGGSWL